VKAQDGGISAPQPFLRERLRGLAMGPLEIAMVAVFCAMAGLAVATQVVADAFAYHENLGPALYSRAAFSPKEAWAGVAFATALGALAAWRNRAVASLVPALALAAVCIAAARGPLYMPTEFVRWIHDYEDVDAVRPVLARGWVGFAVGSLGAAAAVAVVLHGARRKGVSVSHGSAAWGSGDQFAITRKELRALRRARRLKQPFSLTGLVVGRLRDGRLAIYRGEGHLLTAAATRTGKGVGVVVPNVLLYAGGMVVTDIKGTNFFITHAKRHALGQQVVVLDPFLETVNISGVRGTESKPFLYSCNPLDIIRTDREDALDEARMLASMLIQDEEGPNRHFSDEAKAFCTGLILHVCYLFAHEPRRRTLPAMRKMVAQDEDGFAGLIKEMSESRYRFVKEAVSELKQKEAKELSGTLSTFHRNTRFLSSPGMERVLGWSDKSFDPLTIKSGDVTLYIVIPPNRLTDYQAWVRLMIGCIASAMARSEIRRPDLAVQGMFDEFGQLGTLEPIERAVTLLTEYGFRIWMIMQDFNQLKKSFPKSHDTLLGATEIRTMFGTGDATTAELVSKYVGKTTIFAESGNLGQNRGPRKGGSGSLSHSSGESTSEKGRELLQLDEVLRLGEDQLIVLPRGSNPLMLQKIKYYAAPELARDEYGENPLRSAA
jgi:type IV secretion system protein VirD4